MPNNTELQQIASTLRNHTTVPVVYLRQKIPGTDFSAKNMLIRADLTDNDPVNDWVLGLPFGVSKEEQSNPLKIHACLKALSGYKLLGFFLTENAVYLVIDMQAVTVEDVHKLIETLHSRVQPSLTPEEILEEYVLADTLFNAQKIPSRFIIKTNTQERYLNFITPRITKFDFPLFALPEVTKQNLYLGIPESLSPAYLSDYNVKTVTIKNKGFKTKRYFLNSSLFKFDQPVIPLILTRTLMKMINKSSLHAMAQDLSTGNFISPDKLISSSYPFLTDLISAEFSQKIRKYFENREEAILQFSSKFLQEAVKTLYTEAPKPASIILSHEQHVYFNIHHLFVILIASSLGAEFTNSLSIAIVNLTNHHVQTQKPTEFDLDFALRFKAVYKTQNKLKAKSNTLEIERAGLWITAEKYTSCKSIINQFIARSSVEKHTVIINNKTYILLLLSTLISSIAGIFNEFLKICQFSLTMNTSEINDFPLPKWLLSLIQKSAILRNSKDDILLTVASNHCRNLPECEWLMNVFTYLLNNIISEDSFEITAALNQLFAFCVKEEIKIDPNTLALIRKDKAPEVISASSPTTPLLT